MRRHFKMFYVPVQHIISQKSLGPLSNAHSVGHFILMHSVSLPHICDLERLPHIIFHRFFYSSATRYIQFACNACIYTERIGTFINVLLVFMYRRVYKCAIYTLGRVRTKKLFVFLRIQYKR